MPWLNENAYDAFIADAVKACGNPAVTLALVKAIIATESGFRPTAYRVETKINDASRGLMQILLRTAQAVGFTGKPEELFDPKTNITFGTKFLCNLVRSKGGDVLAAISAYNNGNGKQATKTTPVCLARDKDGKCVRTYIAKPGEFFNQPYVDKVLANLKYFGGTIPPKPLQAGMDSLGALIVLGIVLARKFGAFQ